MASRMEKRVLWHPRHESLFIVGGSNQLTLYEYNAERGGFKHITSQTDLQHLKCFAWSPHTAFDDLVAVGMTTGRVELLRLDMTRYSRNNSLPNGSVLTLPVRSSRSCTALAFCHSKPNLLAVGLDKVKGEHSIIVWDLESQSPTTTLDVNSQRDGEYKITYTHSLVQTKPSGNIEAKVVQQFAAQEMASAVAFLTGSPNLLIAGLSGRWLRIFDIRTPQNMYAQVPSKVQSIATDPFDEHRIACIGEGGVVSIWDIRKQINPILTFTSQDASADGARYHKSELVTALEFSNVRRGLLASLEKDGNYVRFWDIQNAQISHTSKFDTTRDASRPMKKSWSSPSMILPWATSMDQFSPPDEFSRTRNSILANTYRSKIFSRPLLSFALVPQLGSTRTLTTKIVVVNATGEIELHEMHDTPVNPAWGALGNLAVSVGDSYIINGGGYPVSATEPWDAANSTVYHDRQLANFSENNGPDKNIDRTYPTNLGNAANFSPVHASDVRKESSLATTRRLHGKAYSTAAVLRQPTGHPDDYDLSAYDTAVLPADPEMLLKKLSLSNNALSGHESPEQSQLKSLQFDVSLCMMKRVLRGYGLENLAFNGKIVCDANEVSSTLSELWSWLDSTNNIISKTNKILLGFDFSFRGIYSLWEGLQTIHGIRGVPEDSVVIDDTRNPSILRDGYFDLGSSHERLASKRSNKRSLSRDVSQTTYYTQAVNTILSHLSAEKREWKPVADTAKLAFRRLMNAFNCWDVDGEQVLRWEKAGMHSQAACWLLFTDQHNKALECLMRSKNEAHHLMSGALAGLIASRSAVDPRNNSLREHYDRLLVKIQDPYCRMMLSYLAVGDWTEVLDEDFLPLRERISIALRFLDDQALSEYFRRTMQSCREDGLIEGLILSGLSREGFDILQSYVDKTGDIQTAAILSCLVCPIKFSDSRAEQWLETYRELLDSWRLFHYRCQLDIERGEILRTAIKANEIASFEWVPRSFLIRCTYCSKIVNSQSTVLTANGISSRTTSCPSCGRGLPRCSICLQSVGIVPDTIRESSLLHSANRHITHDTIDEAFLYCQSCRHGGHAAHVLEWFRTDDQNRRACAVADCSCFCSLGS